jgi:hypothetical protein
MLVEEVGMGLQHRRMPRLDFDGDTHQRGYPA